MTLDDRLHRALTETALCEDRSFSEKCLILRGIRPVAYARTLFKKARDTAVLVESDATEIAQSEVGTVRPPDHMNRS